MVSTSKIIYFISYNNADELKSMMFSKPPVVLAPPVAECSNCGKGLVSYHSCNVKLYTLNGLQDGVKMTLRCLDCRLLYNYSNYGNKHEVNKVDVLR